MAERILCDEGLRVTMSGAGQRALLSVSRSGLAFSLWADIAELDEALGGQPIQVSAPNGFCSIEVREDRVYLEFGLSGEGRKTCDFPISDLEDALRVVRQGATDTPDSGGDVELE